LFNIAQNKFLHNYISIDCTVSMVSPIPLLWSRNTSTFHFIATDDDQFVEYLAQSTESICGARIGAGTMFRLGEQKLVFSQLPLPPLPSSSGSGRSELIKNKMIHWIELLKTNKKTGPKFLKVQ